MTQTDRLLDLLREQGKAGVTPLLALERIGSFRLGARIYDLKAAGHSIESKRVRTTGGAIVACYVLREPVLMIPNTNKPPTLTRKGAARIAAGQTTLW